MADSGRYVYAVARDVDPSTLRGARGIDDAALEIVSHQGLQAVVGDVSLAEFGEEPLRRNLEDLTWLERIARRHDEVVHAVSVSGATAPMRLATICLDDAGVRRRLEEWHDALSSALDRIEGRSEWSVKVVVPAPQRTSTTAEALRASAPGAGAAYLRQKREEAEQRARDEAESAEQAEAVYERLSRGSVARRRLQPQDPKLTGYQGTMTLNAAFLVDDTEREAFLELIDALRGELPPESLHVAGPWPPYSFATLDTP